MMIAAPFLAQANRFREATICWSVSDQHWVGVPVSIFAPTGIPVVAQVKPVVEQHRLWALPTIVEHLEFATVGKGHGFVGCCRIFRLLGYCC